MTDQALETAPEPLTRSEAERITEGIRIALDRTARGMADLAERVSEAYQRRADLALGYESWAEYATAEFGEQTQSLAAPIRRELVGYLSAEGMSTRAIAPAVGVSQRQVSTDVRSHFSPTPTPEPAGATIATNEGVIIAETRHVELDTGETFDLDTGGLTEPEPAPEPAPTPEPRKVTGLDGKTYTAPKQKETPKPRRNPLPEQFFRARYDLTKKVESLVRLSKDDRFAANVEKVARENLSDLNHAIEALQRIVATLQN